MKLNELTTNVKNPRILKDARFKKLLNKILCYPNLLSKNRLTYDSSNLNTVLAGTQRLATLNYIVKSMPLKQLESKIIDAQKALSLNNETLLNNSIAIFTELKQSKEVPKEWIQDVIGLSEDEKQAFILIDNLNDGEWDLDAIANEWDIDTGEWGLISWDVPNHEDMTEEEINGFFEEDNRDETLEKNKIVLEYSDEDFKFVIEKLNEIGGSKESILYKLLSK